MQAGNVTGVNGGPVLGDPRFPPSYRLVGEAADAAADIADADLAYATQHLTTYREPRGAAPPPAVVDPWAQYRHRPQPWSYTQVYGRPGAAASSSSNYYAAPAPPPAVHPTYVRTDRPGGTPRGVAGLVPAHRNAFAHICRSRPTRRRCTCQWPRRRPTRTTRHTASTRPWTPRYGAEQP